MNSSRTRFPETVADGAAAGSCDRHRRLLTDRRKKGKSKREGLSTGESAGLFYASQSAAGTRRARYECRLRQSPKPAKPAPSSSREEGSATANIGP
jgi:hypothetical protein